MIVRPPLPGSLKMAARLNFTAQAGTPIAAPSAAEFLVVSCDPLFEAGVGVRCGGPAEEAIARQVGFCPPDWLTDSRMVRGGSSAFSPG